MSTHSDSHTHTHIDTRRHSVLPICTVRFVFLCFIKSATDFWLYWCQACNEISFPAHPNLNGARARRRCKCRIECGKVFLFELCTWLQAFVWGSLLVRKYCLRSVSRSLKRGASICHSPSSIYPCRNGALFGGNDLYGHSIFNSTMQLLWNPSHTKTTRICLWIKMSSVSGDGF